MSNVGRMVVAGVVGAAIIGAAVVGVMYLKGGGETAPVETPKKEAPQPVVLATPGAGLSSKAGTGDESTAGGPAVATPGTGTGTPAAAGPGTGLADSSDAALAAALAGRLAEAQKLLSGLAKQGFPGPKAAEARKAVNDVAERILASPNSSPTDFPYLKTYEVAKGDSLTTVGKRFLVPHELVLKMNHLATDRLDLGQKLRVVQGPVHVEIAKSRFELTAWCGDSCIRAFPIALGKENATPDGTFLVQKKLRNPPYQPQHKPKSAFRESGAADNPLGTRWIDIGNHYGMHGTIDPTSIGKGASEGCIRLLNKDVEDLFDLVTPGVTKVTIK